MYSKASEIQEISAIWANACIKQNDQGVHEITQSNSDIRKIQFENLSKYGTMTMNFHTCTIRKNFLPAEYVQN